MPAIIGSLLLTAVISYLWGSLPSGYWMGKLLRGKDFDIRDYGSRKIGATNVLRTLGRIPAIFVFILDISKGVGPALLATFVPLFQGNGWGIFVAGLMALLGHCFPVFIGFKGGRGVLTGAGAMLVVSPLTFLISAITTFGTIALSRYVSLGSIVGSLTVIICGIVFYFLPSSSPAHVTLPQMLMLVIVPGLVILFHYDNIGRLLSGKERKIGQKVVTAPATGEQSTSA
ncbi:MAG TPA: glycerol-3-phosphate 1-O-acyltransferase PlsY [Ktedonosporobacter sp.]|nr:glycerol-3-phosphate 1-O-acyltransferase PlsY [Ktedonosporobacter sp.]